MTNAVFDETVSADKVYVCECGKEFDMPQRFNGHKSHCVVHHTNKGTLTAYIEKQKSAVKAMQKAHRYYANERAKKEENEKLKWINEKHVCTVCGKVMTEKFGSGRFCSKSCANSRTHVEELNNRVSDVLHEKALKRYEAAPKFCSRCGEKLPWDARWHKYCLKCGRASQKGTSGMIKTYSKKCKWCGEIFSTTSKWATYCSKECINAVKSASRLKAIESGTITHSSVRSTYRYGTYMGIYCDSSWELAFITYCIDNNIPVKRNTTIRFPYWIDGKEHFYLPDFIVGDKLVEIKGRVTTDVPLKIAAVPDTYKLEVIYKDGIKRFIKYVENQYGKNYCEILYDRNFPCFLDKN